MGEDKANLMSSSATIRAQVESVLAHKIPSALTPSARMVRPVMPTGIAELDTLIQGGLPVGAVTELVGEDCSGRTSVALSFLSNITSSGKIGAWIDASNSLNPASAASVGVDLKRLLWVRCGVREMDAAQKTKHLRLPAACFNPKLVMKGLHGGGHGTHPRSEVKGLSAAVDRFLNNENFPVGTAGSVLKHRPSPQTLVSGFAPTKASARVPRRARVYDVLEQVLRSTDLLIQTGGFGAIVLDLGGIAPEIVARIELSTWHRYRVASEKTQASIVLLSQYPCAKSSSELQLRLHPMEDTKEERTVFSGLNARIEVMRQRFADTTTNVVPMRKPPQRAGEAGWLHRASWVGPR
jgi:recombination protein RecA